MGQQALPGLLLGVALAGCGALEQPAAVARGGAVQSSPAATSEGTGQAGPRDPCQLKVRPRPPPAFRDDIEELASLGDVARLMAWREQVRPAARYAPKLRPGVAFPGGAFSTVRGYAFHFAGSAAFDATFPGCYGAVLSQDGRLCPSVVADGPVLDAAQVDTLLRAIASPPSKWFMGCIFNPHHAFVFYDAKGRPVADVRVCFECGTWSLAGGDSSRRMPEGVFAQMESLCNELQLGGCSDAKSEETEAAYLAAYRSWHDAGAPTRPSVALGIAATRPLAAMSLEERRKLCAWRAVELSGVRDLEVNLTRDWDHPRQLRLQSFERCVETFPACNLPLGEVENIDLRFDETDRFVAPETCLAPRIFGEAGACLWGLEHG